MFSHWCWQCFRCCVYDGCSWIDASLMIAPVEEKVIMVSKLTNKRLIYIFSIELTQKLRAKIKQKSWGLKRCGGGTPRSQTFYPMCPATLAFLVRTRPGNHPDCHTASTQNIRLSFLPRLYPKFISPWLLESPLIGGYLLVFCSLPGQ